MESKTIQITVDSGLCNGCSMCATVCPQDCIRLRETPGGLLEAQIDALSCIQCGACRKVCGGIALDRRAVSGEIDPFKGSALKVFLAKAKDPDLRKNGQSGGAAIAIATTLLESGEINGVLSTEMPRDGSLRPVSRIARNTKELFSTQGSKYVPVPWAAALRELDEEQDRIAVIGIPCQFRGLDNALKTIRKKWAEPISLRIGLVCEGILSYRIFDHIFACCSIGQNECKYYRFKSKIPNGWPGDGRAILFDGKDIFVPNKIRTGCKDAFRPLYCQLCFDKMNILSDLVCADPWGIDDDKEGYTVVLVRTPKGQNALDRAVESGTLEIREISLERFFEAQHVEARRTFWTSATGIVKKTRGTVPDYPVDSKWHAKNVDSSTRRFHEALIERGMYLHRADSRKSVLDSALPFNERLKELKAKIAFWRKWGPVSLAKRITGKILRTLFDLNRERIEPRIEFQDSRLQENDIENKDFLTNNEARKIS